MYQYKGMEDTIAAIATPAGQGAIGIIRVSGKDAVGICEGLLRLGKAKTLKTSESYRTLHGWVIKEGNMLDEVLVTVMRGPKSYTGEDVVEISGHGGMVVLRAVLKAVLDEGARLASPGEFTKRAYLNGRMDLAQAEAVIDIIQAKTEDFLRQCHHQLKGELSGRLNEIRQELLKVYTMVEALINFPEDGIEPQGRLQISESLGSQEKEIARLLESSKSGRLLKEGVRIVLCGKPNVGKSSLLNALLKEQRAIVTPIAGTTRDVLEESAQMRGIPVALVDTAGILEPRDLIEEEAVKRSHLYIKSADVVLLVLDHSLPLEEQDTMLMEQLKTARVLVVVNKIDLPGQINLAAPAEIFGQGHITEVSAFERDSIQALETKIVEMIGMDKDLEAQGIMVSNMRHVKSLEEAQRNLQDACRLMDDKTSLEFVSEEIKAAVNQLDAITGRNIDEDLLDRIFAEFCIGK